MPPVIINDKGKKAFELKLKQEILLSEDQIAFQKTIGVHLSQDEAEVFAYACKKLSTFSIHEIRTVINKPVSACVELARNLVDQKLLVSNSDKTFNLAPKMKQRFFSIRHEEAHEEAHEELNETETIILKSCISATSSEELLKVLGYKTRTGNFKSALSNLLRLHLIEMTIPENPRSKSQKYVLTKEGFDLLKEIGEIQ
jgi:ATP-dependent DNA helicase RecG